MSSKKKATPASETAAPTPSPASKKPAAKADDPAAEPEGADDEEEVQKGEKGKASKDLSNVTGYLPEEAGANVDASKLNTAMTAITDAKATASARKARERELEKVVIAKEDLELVLKPTEH
ncbi:hypothetical protein DFJ74DRAFT_703122 [Hyaloraphidium curvatum]|nr:hypothetical protein DFJ74DRAFT_703122 [Hyaloraphidium curvatum]